MCMCAVCVQVRLPAPSGPHLARALRSAATLPQENWVAVKELNLSYHNGYI